MDSQLGVCLKAVDVDCIKKNNIKRIQLCRRFMDKNNVTSVLKLVRNNNLKVSYYAPMFHQVEPDKTYYLSSNFRLREASFEILETNLKVVSTLPREYVVINFVSDTLSNEELNSVVELDKKSKLSIKRITMLSEKYDLQIHINYNTTLNFFEKPEKWIELVKDSESIKIDLTLDDFINYCSKHEKNILLELDKILPYTESIYIFSLENIEKNVIEEIFKYINSVKPNLPYLFESANRGEGFLQDINLANNIINNKE